MPLTLKVPFGSNGVKGGSPVRLTTVLLSRNALISMMNSCYIVFLSVLLSSVCLVGDGRCTSLFQCLKWISYPYVSLHHQICHVNDNKMSSIETLLRAWPEYKASNFPNNCSTKIWYDARERQCYKVSHLTNICQGTLTQTCGAYSAPIRAPKQTNTSSLSLAWFCMDKIM